MKKIINLIKEKDFIFDYPFYYLEEDFELFETHIADYMYVLDTKCKTYFKTKLEISRLTTDDISFKDPKTNLYGTLDNFGNLKIKPKYESLINIVEHSIHHYGLLSHCVNSKWGLIDTNGKVIVKEIFDNYFNFDEISPFYNLKTAFAKYSGKEGLIDKQGNSINFDLNNAREINLEN